MAIHLVARHVNEWMMGENVKIVFGISVSHVFYYTVVIISHLHNDIVRGSNERRNYKKNPLLKTQAEIECNNQGDYFSVSPAVKVLYWCMTLLWNGK